MLARFAAFVDASIGRRLALGMSTMLLVVLADNAFFFLIVWELMSLLSYFLVVAEHEKPDVRFAGLFYLIMTHVGTAFIFVTFLTILPSQQRNSKY